MRYAAALVGAVLVLSSCGSADTDPYETVEGVVLEVNGDLEKIESFTLRTDDGELMEIVPAPDGDFQFPLSHLHDHRRTLEPILVGLDRSVDPASAVTLRDADTAAWHGGSSDADTTSTSLAPAGHEAGASHPTTTTGAAEHTAAAATSAPPVPTTHPAVDGVLIELVIVDGSVEGGIRREPVGIGEPVTLRVSGNTSDQVHIHGYDLYLDLHEGRGQTTFEASIPGVFEVELERSHTLVLQLEVS